MKTIALYLTLVCLLFSATSCNPARRQARATFAGEPATTVILVRHAEKDYGDDPILTPEGTERARRLAEMLAKTELTAVYSSDTRRTRLTAAPTAEDHDLHTRIYDVHELGAFAHRLRQMHRGETVLVVGHSNTTPALANYLADTDTEARFSELDYGNLLVVTLPPAGAPRILRMRF